MIIKSLELKNFRNYESLGIAFDAGTNILYGDNAQGKTNVLESLYVSGTTKSHKGSKDREMIRFDAEEAHIRTVVEKNGVDNRIDIHLKKQCKRHRCERHSHPKSRGTVRHPESGCFFSGGSEYHQGWSGGTPQIYGYGTESAG